MINMFSQAYKFEDKKFFNILTKGFNVLLERII